MDTSKHLILKDGKDITSDVKFCKYNSETKKYDVIFQNNKSYSYNNKSIEWIKNPERIDPAFVHIFHGNNKLYNIKYILVFHARIEDYWHICFYKNNLEKSYAKSELNVINTCLSESGAKNCWSYLNKLAEINEIKCKDGKDVLLKKYYDEIDFVGVDTAMAIYLNPDKHKSCTYYKRNLIFPFGGNASQFDAVKNALLN